MKTTHLLLVALLQLFSTIVLGQNTAFDICPIKNSEEVPSSLVYSIDGTGTDLKTYIGEKPTVIVFYRGGWCGYCMRHLSELQEVKPQIDSLGYELIAITPDDFSNLKESIDKSELDYTLFSDKKVSAIEAFGIGWTVSEETFKKYKEKYNIDLEWWSGEGHHVLPVPAVFVVEDGKIKYQHTDPEYSQRLSGEVLLSFLRN